MFFPQYPYLNIQDLNLDMLLKDMKALKVTVKNFINFNAIKYADPIQWNITSQYEANTVVMDDVNKIAYLSTQPVPNGVAITNTDYWTPILDLRSFYDSIGDLNDLNTTAKDNLVNAINEVLFRLSQIPIINVTDYGVNPNENVYDALYDLLYDVVNPNGGGILYFPKGKYTVDYTIFIPSNTIIFGDGSESEIYFDETDTHVGCGLATAGSNIGIYNMSVNIASSGNYDVRGALPNTIGIGDFDFGALSGVKRAHETPRHAGNRNLHFENVDSLTSNYSFQIQPKTYAVQDIYIKNHNVPSGMFSIAPNSLAIDDAISNVFVDNLVCDTLRFEGTTNINNKIFINNVIATQFNLAGGGGPTINNFVLNAGDGNRDLASFRHDCAMLVYGSYIISNGKITKSTTANPFSIVRSLANANLGKVTTQFTNIFVEDPSLFTEPVDVHTMSYSVTDCNFKPYANTDYDLLYYTEVDPTWPIVFDISCKPSKSHLMATTKFAGGVDAEKQTVRISNRLRNYTTLLDNAPYYGKGILFKYTDSAAGTEPVSVCLKSDGFIYVERLINVSSPSDWTALSFEINF